MKNNFICKCKKTVSGVTLIALIVTVIVALILAGVGIVTLTSKDEVIEKSKLAKEKIEGYTETEGDMIKDTLKYPNSSDCKHKNTEKRNATGTFSGDTYCLDCGVLLATGTIQPCETHPTTIVTEAVAATCCSKGNTGNTVCTVCGFVVTSGTEIAINPSNHVGGTEIRNATTTYSGDTYCLGCGALISKGSSKIPEGGIYYVGVTSTYSKNYTGATAIYYEGDPFPTISTGDIFVYEDYEYRYNYKMKYTGGLNGRNTSWELNSSQNGWGVNTLSTTNSTYGLVLEKVNGKPIKNMDYTYYSCNISSGFGDDYFIPSTVTSMKDTYYYCNFKTLPEGFTIPNSVTNMYETFYRSKIEYLPESFALPTNVTNIGWIFSDCSNLVSLPKNFTIPSRVSSASYAFEGCTKLTGTIIINTNTTSCTSCFANTVEPIIIKGSSRSLTRFMNSATNGNVTIK